VNCGVEKAFLFGPEYGMHQRFFKGKSQLNFFEDREALISEIEKLKGQKVALMVKGSRKAALEKIVEVLQ
jgi:UDP-N-acetylmuramyl pentapeptide synthase